MAQRPLICMIDDRWTWFLAVGDGQMIIYLSSAGRGTPMGGDLGSAGGAASHKVRYLVCEGRAYRMRVGLGGRNRSSLEKSRSSQRSRVHDHDHSSTPTAEQSKLSVNLHRRGSIDPHPRLLSSSSLQYSDQAYCTHPRPSPGLHKQPHHDSSVSSSGRRR